MPGASGTDAVDHLLEHHRVVALFDRLVRAVTRLGRIVGQREDVLHHAADQNVLELETDLRDIGLAPHADFDLPGLGLRLVPRVSTQRICLGREDPAAIVRDDGKLGGVPVDVEVRVEVLVHRALGQESKRLVVRVVGCFSALVERRCERHGVSSSFRSPLVFLAVFGGIEGRLCDRWHSVWI